MVIIGIDEAGRGPLAGPVAVGVVRIPAGFDLLTAFPGLNDSKKVSEKVRERIFEQLLEQVRKGDLSFHVALGGPERIDTEGISPVIRMAIAEGLGVLMPDVSEGKVWLDGSLHAPKEYLQETVIGGDARVPAIMLASIAAKVTRDRYMVEAATQYAAYGFERHKGYGTVAHRAAIKEHGLSAIHRRTYCHS